MIAAVSNIRRLWFCIENHVGKPHCHLTPRQWQVALLIARGYTNREIAESLTLELGTAANHVEHILRRLGLRNRAQIAAWAIEHEILRLLAESEAS